MLFGKYSVTLVQPGECSGTVLAHEERKKMARTTLLFTVSAMLVLLLVAAFLLMGLDLGGADETARWMRQRLVDG